MELRIFQVHIAFIIVIIPTTRNTIENIVNINPKNCASLLVRIKGLKPKISNSDKNSGLFIRSNPIANPNKGNRIKNTYSEAGNDSISVVLLFILLVLTYVYIPVVFISKYTTYAD